MPNRPVQLEWPWPCSSNRWWARNDGLCIKRTENAAMPMSRIGYVALRPRRGSGTVSTHRATESKRRSRSSILPKNLIRFSGGIPYMLPNSICRTPHPHLPRPGLAMVAYPLQFNNENCCHDGVLLDDADQQNDADQRDQREIIVQQHQ